MRFSLFVILALVSGAVTAGDTYLVEAKHVDYFDVPDDICGPDEICIVHGWWVP